MLKEILSSNWLPADQAETLEQSCPETLFFLQEEFIRHYYPIAQLPPEKLEFVIQKAAEFDSCKMHRLLCWYMYNNFSLLHIRDYRPFPETVAFAAFRTFPAPATGTASPFWSPPVCDWEKSTCHPPSV